MPSNKRGTSTVFCVPAASSQSETTPSTSRTESRTANKVSDDGVEQRHEWRFRPEPLSVCLFLLKIRLLHSVWDWLPWLRVSRRGWRQVPGGARLHLARYLLHLCCK